MVWIHIYKTKWDNIRADIHENQDEADVALKRREGLKLPQKVVEVIL